MGYIYLHVELAVHSFALGIDKLEGVASVAVHVAIAVGCTTVREEEGHLVSRLWAQRNKIPEHVCILRNGNNTKKNKEKGI